MHHPDDRRSHGQSGPKRSGRQPDLSAGTCGRAAGCTSSADLLPPAGRTELRRDPLLTRSAKSSLQSGTWAADAKQHPGPPRVISWAPAPRTGRPRGSTR